MACFIFLFFNEQESNQNKKICYEQLILRFYFPVFPLSNQHERRYNWLAFYMLT